MANEHIEIEVKEKRFYEDFRTSKLLNRYKFNKEFNVKTEVLDLDRDIVRRVYKGAFTIDNDIEIDFMLYSDGGIVAEDICEITEDKEQQEIYDIAIRDLYDKFVTAYNPELLEMKHKFMDGKVTCFINEFIDIDTKFDKIRNIDVFDSCIDVRVFYTYDDGREEDISEIYNTKFLNRIVNIKIESFKDFLQQNAFYTMCRVCVATEDKNYNKDRMTETIKYDYNRFRFEIDVYKLDVEKE